MKILVDLNCDMGESFGNYKIGQDEDIVSYITSANIACGFPNTIYISATGPICLHTRLLFILLISRLRSE